MCKQVYLSLTTKNLNAFGNDHQNVLFIVVVVIIFTVVFVVFTVTIDAIEVFNWKPDICEEIRYDCV